LLISDVLIKDTSIDSANKIVDTDNLEGISNIVKKPRLHSCPQVLAIENKCGKYND
jgi:hypothetical protein